MKPHVIFFLSSFFHSSSPPSFLWRNGNIFFLWTVKILELTRFPFFPLLQNTSEPKSWATYNGCAWSCNLHICILILTHFKILSSVFFVCDIYCLFYKLQENLLRLRQNITKLIKIIKWKLTLEFSTCFVESVMYVVLGRVHAFPSYILLALHSQIFTSFPPEMVLWTPGLWPLSHNFHIFCSGIYFPRWLVCKLLEIRNFILFNLSPEDLFKCLTHRRHSIIWDSSFLLMIACLCVFINLTWSVFINLIWFDNDLLLWCGFVLCSNRYNIEISDRKSPIVSLLISNFKVVICMDNDKSKNILKSLMYLEFYNNQILNLVNFFLFDLSILRSKWFVILLSLLFWGVKWSEK